MNSMLQPDACVIDFQVLSSCVSDKAGQIEILRSYHSENLSDIEALKFALAHSDADAAAKAAHRMKGVSRMAGAQEMQGICLQIETSAKQNDLRTAQQSHSLLEDAMHRIEAFIIKHATT